MPINLDEQIKLLVELQGLDSHIFRIEARLEAIPEDMKRMDEMFLKNTVNLKNLEDNVKTLLLKRKEKEGELEAKEQSVNKFHSQQNLVKTNKEYTALEGEIGRAKADGSVLEEDILKIFDQIDAENKKVSVEKESLKGEEAKLGQEKKKLADESNSLKSESEKLKAARGELAAKVDRMILPKYERLIKGRDGLAITTVSNAACQGCFRVLPPQVLNEIRLKQNIVFCEHCARIIYIEE